MNFCTRNKTPCRDVVDYYNGISKWAVNCDRGTFEIFSYDFKAVEEHTWCPRNVGLSHVEFFDSIAGTHNSDTPVISRFQLECSWQICSHHESISFCVNGSTRRFDVHIHLIRIRSIIEGHHSLERGLCSDIKSLIWLSSKAHFRRYISEECSSRPPESIDEPVLLNHHRLNTRIPYTEFLRNINIEQ